MRRVLAMAFACALLASGAGAFLIANSRVGAGYVTERVPATRLPVNLLVDTEGVPGVASPAIETQDLMNQWNAVAEAEDVFGTASAGGPYNGTTVGQTFGRFTDTQYEVAFDDTGDILNQFGVGTAVLGITLKSVDRNSGSILDVLVVINTQPGILIAPGTGATARELFRATLVHELGHVTGLGHTPVGMVNQTSFGLFPAPAQRIPTMYPFRLPQRPQEGQTIEADDVAGLARIYTADNSGLGALSGAVRSPSGAPISQIHVRAVGPVNGAQHHLGRLTSADGSFRIPNVPPGAYRVIVEPVNGRGGVSSSTLAGATDAFGSTPYVYAQDEYWQPGDGFDPGADDPMTFATVQVRAGRDTGGIDIVLNGAPLLEGQAANGFLQSGDAQLPGFFFADYFVFDGDAGEVMTLNADSAGLIPQLRLLRPSDGAVIAEDLPASGGNAQISSLTLPETGIYTVVLSVPVVTGNPGGTGSYTLTLQGAGDALPPPPQVVGPTIGLGPNHPAAQELGSPVCSTTLLQARLGAPSHEQLWLDQVNLQGSGSGDEARDVDSVRLVHDQNRNGVADGGEPTLAQGTYAADDGALTLSGVDLALNAGQTADLLVVYDLTIESVSSAAGWPAWWCLPLLLPAWFLRRRRATALVLVATLALLPLACAGGDSVPACNFAFNPDGAVVDFQVRVAAGDVLAFTTTSATPVNLLTVDLVSATLSVSN